MPLYSMKVYKMVAACLGASLRNAANQSPEAQRAILHVADHFDLEFTLDNRRFDRKRFMASVTRNENMA